MDRGRLESPGNSGWGGQPMRCSLNGEGMVVVRLDSGVTRVSYCSSAARAPLGASVDSPPSSVFS